MKDLLKAGFRYVYRCWLDAKNDVLLEHHRAAVAEFEREHAKP